VRAATPAHNVNRHPIPLFELMRQSVELRGIRTIAPPFVNTSQSIFIISRYELLCPQQKPH
jgi:hypothetical protein